MIFNISFLIFFKNIYKINARFCVTPRTTNMIGYVGIDE